MAPGFFIFASQSKAESQNPDSAANTARKILKECQSHSLEDWDSGVTSRMAQGSARYNDCLEQQIKNLTKGFFKRQEDQDAFYKALNMYQKSSNELYWLLFNTRKECATCGTMYNSMNLNSTASSLEEILKKIIFLQSE